MASTREQILAAVLMLLRGAAPNGATVERNIRRPERAPAAGMILMRDGDPGDPETTLSPLTYFYDHRIPLEVAFFPQGGQDKETSLDQILQPIGAAIQADRTLGGMCDFLDITAPSIGGIEQTGSVTGLWADLEIIASYATTNPLT